MRLYVSSPRAKCGSAGLFNLCYMLTFVPLLSADNRGVIVYCVTGQILGEIAREGVFRGGKRDQVMFFPSRSTSTFTSTSSSTPSSSSKISTSTSTWTNKNKNEITENKNKHENNNNSNPEFLNKTLRIVEDLLRNKVEDEVFRSLFDDHHDHDHQKTQTQTQTQTQSQRQRQKRQRQSIINLYPSNPPSGISPHVDLPARYADGIVGVCLGSGVGVRFVEVDLYVEGDEEGGLWGDTEEEQGEEEEEEEEDGGEVRREGGHGPARKRHKPLSLATSSKSISTNLPKKNKKRKTRPTSYEVYLPKGTIYILTGEARWSWMHGIEARGEDLVWDDEGGDGSGDDDDDSKGYNESDDGEGEGCSEDDDKPERRQTGRLEETLSLRPATDNPRKRKRTKHTSKRTKQRTATRILRDTRVSITYRWLKPQPRQGTNRSKEEGDEDEEADGGFGGILLQDPVGEGDDWNVR
jgi:hypothetical protein